MIRFFTLAFLILATPAVAQAPKWNVIPEKSHLEFSGTQMGGAFAGGFRTFTPLIVFDPADLAASSVTVDIDIASLFTGDTERDSTAKEKEWFDLKNYPTARFESQSFAKTGDNAYEMTGNLTIRDVTLPVKMPFTLTITPADSGKQHAVMKGHATIDRLQYKLGTGEWADPSSVGTAVAITATIEAER